MTEEEAKKKAEYLIEKGYIVDKDVNTLAKEILQNINKSEFTGRPSPTL